MKRLSHAALLVTITAVALFAEPNSSIQFYEEDGSTETAQMGWDGDNGSFYIETPGSATPLEMKNGDLTVPGEVTAEKFNGDGGGLSNLPSTRPNGAAGGDLSGTYPNPSIGNGKVSTNKLENDAVTSSKLADDAVTTSKIDNKAVTSSKIADEAVGTNQIDDNAVTSSKIANGTITESDLSSSLDSKIDGKMDKSGGTFTGNVTFATSTNNPTAVSVKGNLNLHSTVVCRQAGQYFLTQDSDPNKDHKFLLARLGTETSLGDTWIEAMSRADAVRYGQAHFSAYGPSDGTDTWTKRTVMTHDGSKGVLSTGYGSLDLQPSDGVVKVSGSTVHSSDSLLKRDIRPIEEASTALSRIKGVRYSFRTDEYPEKKLPAGPQVGVIAQEVESVFPELVHTDSEGYKSVNYNKLTAVLIQAVNEQQTQIEKLTRIVQELQDRNNSIRTGPEVH